MINNMEDKLNKDPVIGELELLTYSNILNNIDKNSIPKGQSEYSFFDLEQLVKKFKLDITIEEGITYYKKPAFISKSYYRSKPEYSYNYPRIPIPTFFECSHCGQTKFHSIECLKPFESSLYLLESGSEKYKYPEGTPYIIAVKKRGQKKIYSSSVKVDRFTDNVQLIYEYPNDNKCTIRIAKNGSINIISASLDDLLLPDLIIDKLNETGVLNLEEYQREYPGKNKFFIDYQLSTVSFLFAQFNLYPREYKNSFFINLGSLNQILIKYTKELGMKNYLYNSGDKLSRSNKQTNPFISFKLINNSNETSVLVYKRGAVQIRISKLKNPDIQHNIKLMYEEYYLLSDFFRKIITYSPEQIIYSDSSKSLESKKKIRNTIDSKEPKLCQDRKNNKIRPVPYSFYGKCPQQGYWVDPIGLLRPDGLYEPCCKRISKVNTGKLTNSKIREYLLNGFTGTTEYRIPDPDNLSAVYSPGTKSIESRTFKGLKSFNVDQLISCIENNGYVKDQDVFDKYSSFKSRILDSLSKFTKYKKQEPVALTSITFKNFTSNKYIITPINRDSLSVLFYFDNYGDSYFININEDVSQSSLPSNQDMENTLIEGYLYPYPDELIFYPIDILFYKGVDLTSKEYLNNSRDSRFNYLINSINIIRESGLSESSLDIQFDNRFDQNIIQGGKYYLTDEDQFGEISGLLYIPLNQKYTPGIINKQLLQWNDTSVLSSSEINLQVFLNNLSESLFNVTIDSKEIPESLLPTINGFIKIPKMFLSKNKVNSGDFILFRINIDKFNKIDTKYPLIPISKIDQKIQEYQEVINILESIVDPLSRNTFLDIENSGRLSFNVNGDSYFFNGIDKPFTYSN